MAASAPALTLTFQQGERKADDRELVRLSQNGTTAAFEELVGSHGGLGGNQSKPFLMIPSTWKFEGEIVGAENLHKIVKNELEKLWSPFTVTSSH